MAWMVRVVEADKVTAGGGSGLDFFFSFLGAFGLYGSICWVSHEALTLTLILTPALRAGDEEEADTDTAFIFGCRMRSTTQN